jgi:hypothetical protein
MNDETRAWSRRYFDKMKKMPDMDQAGVYSSTLHYLQAVAATGTTESGRRDKMMKATPINDFFAREGHIREDGRMAHDMYLFDVKKPSESREPRDDYKLVATISTEKAVMNNVVRGLFATPVAALQVPGAAERNAALTAIVLRKRNETPSVQASNAGGWHSDRNFVVGGQACRRDTRIRLRKSPTG